LARSFKVGDRIKVTVDCKQIQPDGSIVNYKGTLGTVARVWRGSGYDVELDAIPGKPHAFWACDMELAE